MSELHVIYDRRSGRIMAVRHGPSLASYEMHRAFPLDERLAVLRTRACSLEQGKRYQVDVDRQVLVEAGAGEAGVNFGLGGSSSRPTEASVLSRAAAVDDDAGNAGRK